MKLALTEDKRFLVIKEIEAMELDQLRLSFTKEPKGSWILKKKCKWIETKKSFVNQFGMIPIGLWYEVVKFCKKYKFGIEFDDSFNATIQDTTMTYEAFESFVDDLFKDCSNDSGQKISPMKYQIEGVFKLLKFKKAGVEITTSGGKTLIAYIMFKFLKHRNKSAKVLYIVPNSQLATQSLEKFRLYDKWCGQEDSFTAAELHSGVTKKEKDTALEKDILFGTFQSLCKKDNEFLKHFDTIVVDEMQHSGNASIKGIITKCTGAERIFGLTGTFPKDDTYESFEIQSYIGPVVFKLSAFTLINREKFATPIYIVRQILNYSSSEDNEKLYDLRKDKDRDDIQAGAKCLKQEQKYANKNMTRLEYICDLAAKAKHNTLILFGDIKGGYGRKIYEKIKESTDKNVYYSDGSTPSDNRDLYKKFMEEDTEGNTVLVASIYTFGEGCDIANLWNIFLVNTSKSDRVIRQIIGRGMRPYEGKDKTVMFDFIDDFRHGEGYYKDNYLYKHGKERLKIYLENKFPVYTQTVRINTSND